jgi:hypothetical protein
MTPSFSDSLNDLCRLFLPTSKQFSHSDWR